jgi:hypothetical protein
VLRNQNRRGSLGNNMMHGLFFGVSTPAHSVVLWSTKAPKHVLTSASASSTTVVESTTGDEATILKHTMAETPKAKGTTTFMILYSLSDSGWKNI